MKVRPAEMSDFDFIVSSQIAMAWETEALALDEKTVSMGCRAVIEDSHKGQYWIVEKGDKPICMCLTIPEWSDWRNGTILWIHSVFTVPEARGSGAYKALYSYLKNKVAADQGLRGLRLYVDKGNVVAQRVYAQLGMNGDHYHLYEWLKQN